MYKRDDEEEEEEEKRKKDQLLLQPKLEPLNIALQLKMCAIVHMALLWIKNAQIH